MEFDSCPNWDQTNLSAAFSKHQWYKYHCIMNMKCRIDNNTKYRAIDIWRWLNKSNTNCDWKQTTFEKKYFTEFNRLVCDDFSLESIRNDFHFRFDQHIIEHRANVIGDILLRQASITSIIAILDSLTKHPAMPP